MVGRDTTKRIPWFMDMRGHDRGIVTHTIASILTPQHTDGNQLEADRIPGPSDKMIGAPRLWNAAPIHVQGKRGRGAHQRLASQPSDMESLTGIVIDGIKSFFGKRRLQGGTMLDAIEWNRYRIDGIKQN